MLGRNIRRAHSAHIQGKERSLLDYILGLIWGGIATPLESDFT